MKNNLEKQKDTFLNNVETENKISVKIENININGEGICLKGNKKICAKNVLVGEEVIIKPTFEKANFISGKVLNYTKKSENRIIPPCPYYNKCGGCNFQFVNYSNSLSIKKQILKEYFKDIYNGEILINASEKEFNYRNKVSFFVLNNRVGFQEEGTNKLVEIDSCMLLNTTLNKVLLVLKSWLNNYKNSSVTHFVIRVLDNQISLVIVTNNKVNNLSNLVESLKNAQLGANFGLYTNKNTNKNIILSENFSHIYGLKTLQTFYKNIKYFVHPNSFMQVNDEVKNKLYSTVLENINNDDIIIEGYSGSGLLSALMATKAKKVYAVEINKNATKDAEKVKAENNLNNLININGDCSKILPQFVKENKNAVFVIDPARNGCDKYTLEAIKKSNIKKIIYISCNPYTLKQNIVFLGDTYKVTQMQLFDMFPQTFHTETFTVLQKK